MIVYITRHGQIDGVTPCATQAYQLSALGRRQAAKLGHRLLDMGFAGRIFASPFHRCLETAQIICDITGLRFWPEARLCEIARGWIDDYTGLTVEQIAGLYPACAPDAQLSYPWWPMQEETGDDVMARVAPFLDALTAGAGQDALLIGHGASAAASYSYLSGKSGGHCNAALSAIQVRPTRSVLWKNDVSHLGPGEVTDNAKVIA